MRLAWCMMVLAKCKCCHNTHLGCPDRCRPAWVRVRVAPLVLTCRCGMLLSHPEPLTSMLSCPLMPSHSLCPSHPLSHHVSTSICARVCLCVSCVCVCARAPVLCLAFVRGYILAEVLRGGPVPRMHEDMGPQQITVTTRRIVEVPHEQPAMRVAGLGGNGGLPPGTRVVKTIKYPPGHQLGSGVSLGTTQQISLRNPPQIPFGSPAPHFTQSTVSTMSTTMSMSSPSRGMDQHNIDQNILKNFPLGSQIVGGGTRISQSPMMRGGRQVPPPPPPMMGPPPAMMGPPPIPGAQPRMMGGGRLPQMSPVFRPRF